MRQAQAASPQSSENEAHGTHPFCLPIMPALPIPPDPKLDAPTHGKMAQYFAGYSTADLIQLIRQTDPFEGADEDEAIAAAHGRGEASHLDLLIGLHERASREVFDAAVALCRDPDPHERYLGLRILRELGEDRPLFPETWNLLEDMAKTEEDTGVLWWVVSSLLFTFKPRALPTLLRFVSHRDPGIRRSIAFGITGCALDPNQAEVVEAQLRLAEDEVADVRYYAVYDFTEDIMADSPEIRAMLRRRLTDPDERIREKATEALRMRRHLEVEECTSTDEP